MVVHYLDGAKRVAGELKRAIRAQDTGESQVYDVEPIGDDGSRWRFKVKAFDDAIPGGRELNADLALLARQGQDHLLFEVAFPTDYPTSPFFLRVVSPRCRMYTGHVTVGGSICAPLLVQTGTDAGWQPSYTFEGVMMQLLHTMVTAETVLVKTPSGPGGMGGPLRIDFKYPGGPLVQYSEREARTAFTRMLATHRQEWMTTATTPDKKRRHEEDEQQQQAVPDAPRPAHWSSTHAAFVRLDPSEDAEAAYVLDEWLPPALHYRVRSVERVQDLPAWSRFVRFRADCDDVEEAFMWLALPPGGGCRLEKGSVLHRHASSNAAKQGTIVLCRVMLVEGPAEETVTLVHAAQAFPEYRLVLGSG